MMGFLSSIKEQRSRVYAGVHPSSAEAARIFGLHPTTAGIHVDSETALGLSAYWAAIRNISEDVAKLPLGVYLRAGQNRTEIATDPVALLMNDAPNGECIPLTFRQTMTSHALSHGRGVAEIEWANNGRPMALWPAKAQDVQIDREKTGAKRLVFIINSVRLGRTVTLYDKDVIHLMGMSLDGVQGVSVLQYARESLGMSIAAERFGSSFFGNSGVPSLAIKLPLGKTLKDGGKKLKESWGDAHRGSKNRGVGVLEDGTEIVPIGIPPEDSQFLQTRQFQVSEVARWFRMPPHKLMDLLRGTFSNIEHQSIEYVGDCLDPWLRRWEQEIQRKFFGRGDGRYARHNTAALLRTDTESRYRAHAMAIQWGWRNPDDVRALEDENPLPDGQGEAYMRPANMIASTEFGKDRDVNFQREVVKAFIADGTVSDVIANSTNIGQLVEDSGLPRQPGYEEPWLPVIADSGPAVTGEVLKDSEGDIVGGVADAPEPPPEEPNDDPDGDDPDPPDDDEQDRARLAPMMESYRPVLADALMRSIRVEADRVKRHAGRENFPDWLDKFYGEQVDEVRGAVFPFAEAVASLAAASGIAGVDARAMAKDIAARHVGDSRSLLDGRTGEAAATEASGWLAARAEDAARAEIARITGTLTGERS